MGRIFRVVAILSILGAILPLTSTQRLLAASTGRAAAPQATAAGEPGLDPGPRFISDAHSSAFAISVENMVTFDSATPGIWTVIGSTAGQSLFAGDFKTGESTPLYAIDFADNKLYAYDVTNAARTLIGSAIPVGSEVWTGMTSGPDGTMYGASTDCLSQSTLYTINLATGAVTTIGSTTNAKCVIDIAMNSAGALYGVDILGDNLVRIDPVTGAGTVIGALGFDADCAQGMDFDATDTLYWAANACGYGQLRTIDTSTGVSTLVGAFPGGALLDCLAFVIPPLTLGEAVDQTSLTWSASGDGSWHGQAAVTHDGVDAARSGRIGDDQSTTLGTTTDSLAAPTMLTFWWKVSSEAGNDFLRFSVDGTERAAISGDAEWTQIQVVLAPGAHDLAWVYAKGAAGSAGSDAAWLDQVTFSTALFYDDFSDGKLIGDPEWVKMQGIWKVKSPAWNGGKLYQSSSAGQALSTVKSFTTNAAQVRARFKIGSSLDRPSVSFVFDVKSPTKYRYVEIRQKPTGKWQAFLKQKGSFDNGVQRTIGPIALPGFRATSIHTMRLDIYADGGIVARLDDKVLFDKSFGGGGSGSVGLKSDFTTVYADDFTVYDGSVLP